MAKTITMDEQGNEVRSKELNPVVKEEVKPNTPLVEVEKDIKQEKVATPPEKTNTDSNIRRKKKIMMIAIIAGSILLVIGIAAFYYFGIYKLKPKDPSEIVSFNSNYIASNIPTAMFATNLPLLSQPTEPRTEESPLNGLLFSKKEMDEMKTKRPVAVIINNHVDARPQSGLTSADVVYETNAESGITRYLAIFWSSAPEKVGSIRSLRQYYLEWLSEYDPILIHDGCADTNNPLTNACGNVHTYGIKDISTYGAWRWNDRVRVAPHNEYSSVTNAWEYAKKMNWNSFPSSIGGWMFKKDADLSQRGERTIVKLAFHSRLSNQNAYDAVWTYDRSTNSYMRKIGNRLDIDQENNTQVTAKNVVIQQVQMSVADDHGRLILKTIGEGDAVILQDGKIINGRWKKSSRLERTKYYDAQGKQILFNRGKVWISAIGKGMGQFNILEQ